MNRVFICWQEFKKFYIQNSVIFTKYKQKYPFFIQDTIADLINGTIYINSGFKNE